ncbi:hypothetical protein ALQ06_200119 [Pseudomonas syringae pv. berberidis]|nr:hypothetical protein ALQ06_200119 [Pseudomonas syringae pv. berberidis]
MIRGGNCHDLYVRIIDQLLPVSVAAVEPPGTCALLGASTVGIRQRAEPYARRQVERSVGIAER